MKMLALAATLTTFAALAPASAAPLPAQAGIAAPETGLVQVREHMRRGSMRGMGHGSRMRGMGHGSRMGGMGHGGMRGMSRGRLNHNM